MMKYEGIKKIILQFFIEVKSMKSMKLFIYLPEASVAITAARKSTGKIASRCFISLPFGFLTFLKQAKFATTDNTKITKKYGFGSDQPWFSLLGDMAL